MKRRSIIILMIVISITSCTNFIPPSPTVIPPTVTQTVIPTLLPPENTPTLPPTETATPPANPIQRLPAGTEVTITTIQMADLNRGWAIGTTAIDPNDHILLTTDGGTNWKDVTPPEGMDAAGGKVATVFFKGADTAWVIYSSNVIQSPPGNAQVWRTADGGVNWTASQPIEPSGTMEFFSPGYFSFPDDQHGWLLVHAGAGMSHDYIYVYGTTDGGASWVKLVDPIESDQAGTGPSMGLWKTGMSFADAQMGWITYENGGVAPGVTLYQTLDGGHAWALQSLPAPSSQADLFTNQNYSCGVYNLTFLDSQKGNMVVTCMMGSGDIEEELALSHQRCRRELAIRSIAGGGGRFANARLCQRLLCRSKDIPNHRWRKELGDDHPGDLARATGFRGYDQRLDRGGKGHRKSPRSNEELRGQLGNSKNGDQSVSVYTKYNLAFPIKHILLPGFRGRRM